MAAAAHRVRVYDARDIAEKMVRTFKDRDVEVEEEFDFDWPNTMQHIGDSVGVAYASDKWKPKDKKGKRDWEIYKHIAESRNRILCAPNIIHWEDRARRPVPTIGPRVSFAESHGLMMPNAFAILGIFKEVNVILHVSGNHAAPEFGKQTDDGVLTLYVRHGLLGGCKMRRSESTYQPFLFVYTPGDGVHFIIVGEELDVEKDGIVG